MLRIISALLLVISSWVLPAHAAQAESKQSPELAPDAPARHVVVTGDTLWGIASTFLKDPYRWNEIWHMNDTEIRNPDLIYPGQVIVLDRSGASPVLRLANGNDAAAPGGVPTVKVEPQIRIEEAQKAIPAIPQQVIEPFLTQPLVADESSLDDAPRIIGIKEDRVMAGSGDTVYAVGGKPQKKQWQVFRPGKALVDPVSGDKLGYEAVLLGTATLVKTGETSAFQISNAKQEVGRDDRLLPAPAPDILTYPQRLPERKVDGRVIAIYGSGLAGSTYSIISVSRGKRDGLAVGHVLALYTSARDVSSGLSSFSLPEEHKGLIYVFRVFDRVAYALVMKSSSQVVAGDTVRNP